MMWKIQLTDNNLYNSKPQLSRRTERDVRASIPFSIYLVR